MVEIENPALSLYKGKVFLHLKGLKKFDKTTHIYGTHLIKWTLNTKL